MNTGRRDKPAGSEAGVSDQSGDAVLTAAGITRRQLAVAFRVTEQRIGQIIRGEGVSYNLANEIRRYINSVAGKTVCANDSFILQPRKEGKKRRRPPL